MCGIIGSKGKRTEDQIRSAAKTIAHRGPDAFGCYEYNDVIFAHHRLSILELSERGAQPYHFENLTLIYNGEIYNFREVRADLIKHGYHFISDSDTEVVIKSFHYWGCDAVERFTGMFAFAIHDQNDDVVYLFRDRIGIKPLYYSLEDGLVFGSEFRTVLPFLEDKRFDHESVYEYFRVGYISEDKTIYQNAKKLLPAHYLIYKNGEAKIHKYWSLDVEDSNNTTHTEKEWKDDLHTLMIDAFGLRMVSDVPVGVFLSGGIDSSLVTSILQNHYGKIHTFTISFNDERYDEAPYAKKIAKHLGTNHTEFTLEVDDAHAVLEKFYDIYDEPFADSSGIPSTVVSKLAAQAGIKVVLSANGGDELFAGYKHYNTAKTLYEKNRKMPDVVKSIISAATKSLYNNDWIKGVYQGNIEHKLAALNEMVNTKHLGEFYQSFLANQATLELNSLLRHPVKETIARLPEENISGLMYQDLLHYLPDDLLVKMDRATMHNSIEGREPFLDHRLVEMSRKMPLDLKYRNGESKWILKEILSEYVPREYFIRPKKGFSIPIFKWFSEHLDHLFEYYLAPEKISATGLFHVETVEREYKKYLWNKRNGKESNIEKMWRLLSFMMWYEKWHDA